MSAEHKASRRVGLGLACLALVASSCLDWDSAYDDAQVERSPARYLDTLCANGAYELEGDARRTTGLTGDSCGFALGAAPSVVRFDASGWSGPSEAVGRVLVADAAGDTIANPRWEALRTIPRAAGDPPQAADFEYRSQGKAKYVIDVELEYSYAPFSEGCAIGRGRRAR